MTLLDPPKANLVVLQAMARIQSRFFLLFCFFKSDKAHLQTVPFLQAVNKNLLSGVVQEHVIDSTCALRTVDNSSIVSTRLENF